MARIHPIAYSEASGIIRAAYKEHVCRHQSRITNTKGTLARSLASFRAYMQWYVLYEELEQVLGKRLASLYAYSVSKATECAICTAFFRKLLIESGVDPDALLHVAEEQQLLGFGSTIARTQGHVADHVYNCISKLYSEEEIVLLVAFSGQMIATNIFNNAMETDIDDHLLDFLQPAVPASNLAGKWAV